MVPTTSDSRRQSIARELTLRERARRSGSAGVLQGDASDTVDGTEGNERLTAATGALLIVLLAALGITIINLRLLIWEHLFLGLVLLGPVAIKLVSTGYRFLRYYTGNPVYVRKGPPPLLLRLLGPGVVLTTVLVFVSGAVLLFAGPSSRDTWFSVHKLSFIAWLAFMGVHVLGHLPSLPKALRGDYATRKGKPDYLAGRDGRVIALAGALVAGLVVAIILIPDFAGWTHSTAWIHHHHDG
jgi:hypothetical protein